MAWNRWTEAISRHGQQIARLRKLNYLACDSFFLYPKRETGSEEYGLWLNQCLNSFLSDPETASSQTLPAFFSFLEMAGDDILKSLGDPDLGRRFRGELWPKFHRVVSKASEEQGEDFGLDYISYYHLHVWDLLQLPNGEELLQAAGQMAVDMLFGEDKLEDVELRAIFANSILGRERDSVVLNAVREFHGNTAEDRKFQELARYHHTDWPFSASKSSTNLILHNGTGNWIYFTNSMERVP